MSFVDALDAASSISPLSATLTKNTRGWGVPSFSANSVPSALKSTRALPSTDPFDAHHCPLAPIPTSLFKSVPVSDLCVLCVSAFSSLSLSLPFDFKLSTVNLLSPISFGTLRLRAVLARRIRTYVKHTRNPFRMNTSKTQDLRLFRMNTYEKTGGAVPPVQDAGLAERRDNTRALPDHLPGSFSSGAGSWDDKTIQTQKRSL